MAQEIIARALDTPLADLQKIAEAMARSRMFGFTSPDQALVLMLISQAEGRHPALAARDYDIIQGRPVKKAEAMLRDFFTAGGKVEWHGLDDTVAEATFSHPQGGMARIRWDIARAQRAGLASREMYHKFARQMLRSRTVSEGVRTVWPLATSGFYVPEEAADMVDITPPPTPTASAAPPAHCPPPAVAVSEHPRRAEALVAWRIISTGLKAATTTSEAADVVAQNWRGLALIAEVSAETHATLAKRFAEFGIDIEAERARLQQREPGEEDFVTEADAALAERNTQ